MVGNEEGMVTDIEDEGLEQLAQKSEHRRPAMERNGCRRKFPAAKAAGHAAQARK